MVAAWGLEIQPLSELHAELRLGPNLWTCNVCSIAAAKRASIMSRKIRRCMMLTLVATNAGSHTRSWPQNLPAHAALTLIACGPAKASQFCTQHLCVTVYCAHVKCCCAFPCCQQGNAPWPKVMHRTAPQLLALFEALSVRFRSKLLGRIRSAWNPS